MLPNLIDLTNFCNSKGFDLVPVRQGAGVSCNLFKDDVFIKEGEIVYKSWRECQLDAYSKLYKLLTKKK